MFAYLSVRRSNEAHKALWGPFAGTDSGPA